MEDNVDKYDTINVDALAALVEHYARLVETASIAHGLTPAQWSFLRYVNQANESARTVSAFAHFHATTKSAASQTLRLLQRKGLIDVTRSRTDQRLKQLAVSPEGLNFLRLDPLRALRTELNAIESEKLAVFAEVLVALINYRLGVLPQRPAEPSASAKSCSENGL
jgi:DNA-binding MarR family transcriptional regulator